MVAETALGPHACLDMMPTQTEGGDRPELTRLEVKVLATVSGIYTGAGLILNV